MFLNYARKNDMKEKGVGIKISKNNYNRRTRIPILKLLLLLFLIFAMISFAWLGFSSLYSRYFGISGFQAQIEKARSFHLISPVELFGKSQATHVIVASPISPFDNQLTSVSPLIGEGKLNLSYARSDIPMNITVIDQISGNTLFTTSRENLSLGVTFKGLAYLNLDKQAEISFHTGEHIYDIDPFEVNPIEYIGGSVDGDASTVSADLVQDLSLFPETSFNITFDNYSFSRDSSNFSVSIYDGTKQLFRAERQDASLAILVVLSNYNGSVASVWGPDFNNIKFSGWDSLKLEPSSYSSEISSNLLISSSLKFPQGELISAAGDTSLIGTKELAMQVVPDRILIANNVSGVSFSMTGFAYDLQANGQDINHPSLTRDFVTNLPAFSGILGLIGISGILGLFGATRKAIMGGGKPILEGEVAKIEPGIITVNVENNNRSWFSDPSAATGLTYTYAIYEIDKGKECLIESGLEQTSEVLFPGTLSERILRIHHTLEGKDYHVIIMVSCKEGSSIITSRYI